MRVIESRCSIGVNANHGEASSSGPGSAGARTISAARRRLLNGILDSAATSIGAAITAQKRLGLDLGSSHKEYNRYAKDLYNLIGDLYDKVEQLRIKENFETSDEDGDDEEGEDEI